jgi:invasion protein IalB
MGYALRPPNPSFGPPFHFSKAKRNFVMDDKTRNLLTYAGAGVGLLAVGLIGGWIGGVSSAHDGAAKIEVFKDWRLACPGDEEDKDKDGKPDKGVCALATDITDQASGQRVVQITMGAEAGKPDVEMMVLNVPLNVLVPPGLTVQIGGDNKTVPYATCLPSGCVATMTVDDKTADEMRTAQTMNLVLTGANSRSVTIPVSVQGYSEASSRMNSIEARRRSWWRRLWS